PVDERVQHAGRDQGEGDVGDGQGHGAPHVVGVSCGGGITIQPRAFASAIVSAGGRSAAVAVTATGTEYGSVAAPLGSGTPTATQPWPRQTPHIFSRNSGTSEPVTVSPLPLHFSQRRAS